ncbi:hypothetical protein ABPG74_005241 [Tetrahymena malaccensis]
MGLNNFRLIADQLKFFNNLIGLSLQVQLQQEGQQIYIILCENLKEMINLQHLELLAGNSSQMHETGAQSLGLALASLKNLKSLKLVINSWNHLNILGCQYISQGIQCLNQLQELNLTIQKNNINTEGVVFLSQALKKLHNLQSLIIVIGVQNFIKVQGAQALSEGYKDLLNIKYLNISILSENSIESEGTYSIGVNLKNLIKIEKLYLYFGSENQIGAKGLIGLGQGIQHLENLNHLQFTIDDLNYLNQEGIQQFKESVLKLQKINHLELSFQKNMLNIEGLNQISELISSQINVQNLSLFISNNQIDSFILKKISESFEKLKKLQILNLNLIEDAAINDEGFQSIFDSLKLLDDLKYLNLSTSFKSILCDYSQIGSSLAMFKSLQKLSFCINKIIGIDTEDVLKICEGISQMKNLKILTLNFCLNEIDDNDEKNNLTKALKLLQNVEILSLDLQRSELKEIGLNQIAEGISGLNQLKQLQIEQFKPQYFGIECVANFLKQIRQLRNINQLKLNINERSLHIKQQEIKGSIKILKMSRLVKYEYF